MQRQLNTTEQETLRYSKAVGDRREEVEALSKTLQDESSCCEEATKHSEELRTEINNRYEVGALDLVMVATGIRGGPGISRVRDGVANRQP